MAIYQDGHSYTSEADVPDIGHWTCASVEEGGQRNYFGLASEIIKLPVYDDLAHGSTAYCVDTGAFYMFNASTATWTIQ